jgi:Glycosyl transferase family 2
MPTVSVIMPVYNAERFVAQAVASVLAQTFQDFELLIIDDGSTDHSLAQVTQFGSVKVRCLRTPTHAGASQARNLGLAQAQGQFIAFLDADDVAKPDRLQKQIDFLAQHPNVGLLGTWADVIDEVGQLAPRQWTFSPEPSAHLPVNLLFHNRFILSSVMLRAELVQAEQFDPQFQLAEDYDLWVRLARRTACAILPERLVGYRAVQGLSHQRAGEMTANTRQIVRRQLAELGLTVTEEALGQHIRLGKLELETGLAALQASAQWLAQLMAANQQKARYAPRAFHSALGHLWFHAFTYYTGAGWRAVRILSQSPLTRCLPVNQQFRLWALLVKHSLSLFWPRFGPRNHSRQELNFF